MSEAVKKEAEKLTVRILSPAGKLYDGPAVSVTATNKVGPFDILVGHANFFSLLSESDVVVKSGGQPAVFPITKGLIKVKANAVTLFVNPESNGVA